MENVLFWANLSAMIVHLMITIVQLYLSKDKAKWKFVLTENVYNDITDETIAKMNEEYESQKTDNEEENEKLRRRITGKYFGSAYTEQIWQEIDLAKSQALFSFICFLAHAFMVFAKPVYDSWISSGVHYGRWFEYAISASIMMINIAGLCGIRDKWHHFYIFGCTAVMNLLGLFVETSESFLMKLLIYSVAFIPFILPWVQISEKFSRNFGFFEDNFDKVRTEFIDKTKPQDSQNDAEEREIRIPSWVRDLIRIMFAMFCIFPLIQLLQISGLVSYENGELLYILASFMSKATLTWIVYGGAFRNDEPPEYLQRPE